MLKELHGVERSDSNHPKEDNVLFKCVPDGT